MASDCPYTLFVQPVYRRDSDRLRLWGNEVLVRRVCGGAIESPRKIFSTFTGPRDWWRLDFRVLKLCTQRAEIASSPYALCLNVSSATLENTLFRREYIRALERLTERRNGVLTVMEFPEDLSLPRDELSLVIEELRDAGVRCAMDDFGKANSDVARLRDHSWDYCKVDWTIGNRGSIDLAHATRLCESLNVEAIVEGVETPWDLASLVGLSVSAVQGFLLHEPYFPSPANLQVTAPEVSLERPMGIAAAPLRTAFA